MTTTQNRYTTRPGFVCCATTRPVEGNHHPTPRFRRPPAAGPTGEREQPSKGANQMTEQASQQPMAADSVPPASEGHQP